MPEGIGTAVAAGTSGPAATGATGGSDTSSASQATSAPVQSSQPNTMAAFEAAKAGKGRDAVIAAAQPAPDPAQQQQSATPLTNEAGNAVADLGLTEKQVQALKRAHALDMAADIPAERRSAWADAIAAKLSDRDRKYQQDRQQNKQNDAGNPDPGAEPDGQQTASDKETGKTEPAAPEGDPSDVLQWAYKPEALEASILKSIEMPKEEADTLASLVGEDYAQHLQADRKRLATTFSEHLSRAMQLNLNMSSGIARDMERAERTAAVNALKGQPGFDKIDLNPEARTALIAKAEELIRAKADFENYRYEQAIPEAAATLFNVNPRLAARAELAQTSDPYLQSSGVKPTARLAQPRALTDAERTRQAFILATQGKKASEIQAELAQ
jgi:hypothetical protein